MPYQSWEMLGCGVDHTLLNLEGGVTQISVQIKVSYSLLSKEECFNPILMEFELSLSLPSM